MKVWVILGILILNLLLQSAFFPFLQLVGVKPDTLIMLVVSFSLLSGSNAGLLAGLAGGLMQDILYGGAVGYYALQYMTIGWLFGYMHGHILIGRFVLPAMFAAAAVMLRGIFMFVYMFFLRTDVPLYQMYAAVVIPEAVYTALLMPLLYYFMSNLYQKRFMTQKLQFKRPD